jgi:hypothetical protein
VNSFIDIIVLVLFVLFLFFIFRGYHQSKLEERENNNAENGPAQKGEKTIE